MKKLFCILLAALMLMGILAACGNDGDKKDDGKKEEEKTAAIVGTWEYAGIGCSYTFNEDGTGKYTFTGNEMPFTYKDDGSKLEIQYENSDFPNEFNYTIEGKTLHIEDSFGSIVDYTKK